MHHGFLILGVLLVASIPFGVIWFQLQQTLKWLSTLLEEDDDSNVLLR